MKMKQIKSLAKEFFGAPSAEWSIEGADMSVLEKWFKKLGVGWVLHFADGADPGELEETLDVSSWIQALNEIRDALCLTGWPFEGEPGTDIITEVVQSASFIQQAILKLLAFVDFIDVPDLDITCEVSTTRLVAPYKYQKLYAMLRVHNALFTGLPSHPPPFAQVGRIQENLAKLLSAKTRKAGEAMWNTMEEIRNGILKSVEDDVAMSHTMEETRNRILESVEDFDSSGTENMSPGIHEAIRSVLSYIRFLDNNSMLVCPFISEAASLGKYVPRMGCEDHYPLHSLNVEMFNCVQEKLANKSQKFTDQSLRFIILLSNQSFIGDLLHCSYFPISYNAVHTGKVEGYMDHYIQVSWAPVLACLFNPKPLRLFGKNYSPLLKFESEFHKTYTTQKLWKVPDPKLRKTLREAIIVKMVPSYRNYLEDNKVTTPEFTPWNLEEMLQELFEG